MMYLPPAVNAPVLETPHSPQLWVHFAPRAKKTPRRGPHFSAQKRLALLSREK
jgi:hypothetical protein